MTPPIFQMYVRMEKSLMSTPGCVILVGSTFTGTLIFITRVSNVILVSLHSQTPRGQMLSVSVSTLIYSNTSN